MEIRNYIFSNDGLQLLKQHPKGQNWPVVYLIDNDKQLYVGETTSAGGRFNQHLNNPERKSLINIRFIFDDQFNKSAILDIEQTLIQMFLADQKYKLQNKNGGQSCKHDYYQRALYQSKVDEIWNELKRHNITKSSSSEIRNSNLFKYSPYNTLTPEQEAVSHEIISNILDTLESDKTGTSILSGKAGTGKSIVVIHMIYTLMSAMNIRYNDGDLGPEEQLELLERISISNRIREYVDKHGSLKIAFVVPMTSIRKTFKAVFKASKDTGLNPAMVIGPQEVVKENGKYDVIFVDESHRLARRHGITSYGSFDEACRTLDIDESTSTQLDMIQIKSRYSVLVYDENQTVKSSDLTAEQFESALVRRDVRHRSNLKSQMRCEGGVAYTQYLDDIFQVNQSQKLDITSYDFKIWDDPNAMIREIRHKDSLMSLCRVVAGYSWEWKSKECITLEQAIDNGLEDIELDGEKYVWNMSNQEWILRPGAVNEIGCVHTTQGYDLNYVAVIFGKEIDYDEQSQTVTIDRSKFYDTKVKSGVDDSTLKKYIVNSYKVMMTRGIKGCYVYACNQGMQNYLKRFMDTYR